MWNLIWTSIFLVCVQFSANVVDAQRSGCAKQALDVVFVLDSSSSIWRKDWESQISFVHNVVNQFELGNNPDQTRIGVVTFANSYYLQFHLWQNNRWDLITRALNRIRHRAGKNTNTGAAIKYMAKYMFSHRYGSRKHAAHVAIVITDGRSQDRRKTLAAAQYAKNAGIHLFAIGVGDQVDYRELEQLASQPPEQYIFSVDDFASLDAMKYIVANKTCQGTLQTTTVESVMRTTPQPHPSVDHTLPPLQAVTIPIPPSRGPGNRDIQADIDPRLNVTNCGGKPADIYFALDASNSIWPEDFKKQINFVRDLIMLFDVSDEKTRVGLVTFSDTVKPIFDFSTKQDKANLIAQMANITFMSGRTKTADAIKFIHEQGFSRDVARREVAHIVLLFTDGLSKSPHLTAREAELAKRDGIYLFSIGIGMSVERTELRDIASDPDDDFVFHVSNFSLLNTIKNILAIKTCSIQADEHAMVAEDKKCNVNVETDLMFLYDSAQLGIPRSRKITKFLYDVTSALDMDSGLLQVGRLMENCLTRADVFLSKHKHSMDFDEVYFPDFRRMIRRLASTGFAESYGARRDAKKVAVLFLDDEMENLKQASDEMRRLRDTHTLVVTIGNADLFTAAEFSSRPANDYIVHIPSYKYLHTAKYTLIQKLCRIFGKDTKLQN